MVRLFLQVYLLISDWQRRTLVLRRKSLLLWGVIWCMVGLWQPTLPLDTVHSSICHFSPRAVIMLRTDIPPSSREIAYGGNPFCRAFSLRAQFFSTCFVGGAIICLRFYHFRVLSVASKECTVSMTVFIVIVYLLLFIGASLGRQCDCYFGRFGAQVQNGPPTVWQGISASSLVT